MGAVAGGPPAKPPKALIPPAFSRVIWSQTLSHFGDDFEEVAVVVFALKISDGNPAALGLLMAMTILPVALFGWVAAGVVDRWDKKRFMVTADIVRGVLVMSIPIVNSLAWAMAAVFVAYLIEVAYMASVQSVGPELAGDPKVNAVGMARIGQGNALGDIVAYLAASALILSVGLTSAFAIDALTFIASAALIVGIRAPANVWRPSTASAGGAAGGALEGALAGFLRQIGEAAHHIRRSSFLLTLYVITVPVALATATVNVLLGPSVQDLWNRPTAEYGWLQLGIAVGVLAGMWVMARLVGTVPFPVIMAGSVIGFGLTAALYPFAPTIWWAIAISFLGGIANAGFQMPSVVWIQQNTAPDIRARVLIFRRVIGGLGAAAGSIGGGWVAHTLALPVVYWGAAVLVILAGAALGTSPALRKAARPAPESAAVAG